MTNAPTSTPRLAYSAKEAAAMLDSPYETILAEIRADRLVARKVGKEYRIHRDVLDEYLKCPAPKSQRVSEWIKKPAIGGFSDQTVPDAGLGYEAKLLAKLRSKPSPTN